MKKRILYSVALLFISLFGFSQEIVTITGTITDMDDNSPLENATVSVQGNKVSVVAVKDGKFSIKASVNDALVITYSGYERKVVKLNGRTIINIKLNKVGGNLDEVVVIGYSQVRKKDIAGSSSFLNDKDIQKANALSAAEIIQGRIPGVQVISSDGSPGGGITLNLRGNNSILAGTTPLLVIDGIPFVPPAEAGFNPFSVVNPNDIESITVLKDASATAQYGAEAANGVIVITTKKGKQGKVRVNLNAGISTGKLVRYPVMMNAEQYAYNMKQRIDNNPAIIINNPQFNGLNPWDAYISSKVWEQSDWTNWLDAVTQDATIKNVSLDVSGALGSGNFYLSAGYYNERGLLSYSGFKRYTANAKINQNINSKFAIGVNAQYTKNIYDGLVNAWGGLNGQGLFNNALIQSPALPKNDPTGDSSIQNDPEFNANPSGLIFNPFTYLKDVMQDRFSDFFQARADVTYKITSRLSWKNSYSAQLENRTAQRFENSNTREGRINNGILEYRTYRRVFSLFQSQLNYQVRKEKHFLDANAIFESKEYKTDEFQQRLTNISVQNLGYYSGSTSTLPSPGVRLYDAASKASVIGIVNYTFDNRFIATASLRADGSSNFGPSKRWGYFPAAALAWRISNEKFMSGLKESWLSDFKLRTSFGITGNDQIPSYRTLSTLGILSQNSSAQLYPFYNGGSVGYGINVGPTYLPNPDLKWEQTIQYNAGVDLAFLRNRINLTVDYYYKKTNDMLLERSVASYIFPDAPVLLENRGELQNSGWEFDLKGSIIKQRNFSWDMGFNISFNRNKILYLGQDRYEFQFNGSGLDNRFFPIRVRVGESIGKFYGIIQDGVYNNLLERANRPTNTFNNSLGALGMVDVNGDGRIDRNDMVEIGSTLPLHTGGINTTIVYKNFDLYVFGRWSYGNDVINANFDQATEARYNNNVLAAMENQYWTSQNPERNYYFLGGSNRNNLGVLISEYVEDGSFFRLDRVTLGYSIPKKIVSKLKISAFRISATAENLAVISRYSWFDPEVNTGTGNATRLGPGIDRSAYPRARRLGLSLTCNF